MKSYWSSEDMSVQVETLESFLRSSIEQGEHQHTLFATIDDADNVVMQLRHAALGDGLDYKVMGNAAYPAHPAFGLPERSTVVVFERTGNGRLFELSEFSVYINALECLRRAVEAKDKSMIAEALQALRDLDSELGVDEDEEAF